MAPGKRRRRTTSRICSAALACALLLSLGATGVAQTPKERARVLFREANELFARKMFLDALNKYRAAKAVFPSYKIDLNIGGTLDALGRRTEAAVYFERFLVQSAAAPPEIIATAKKRLEQLGGKLGRVKVTTILDGAAVLADGVRVGTAPLDIPVYLEPGQHRLEARKPGARSGVRTITVTAGQDFVLDISPAVEADAPVSAPSAPTPEPAAATQPFGVTPPGPGEPDPALAERRRSKTLWGWISLGVGGACALTAAVLYGVGGEQVSSATERYDAATDPDEIVRHWADVEAGQDKVIAGHVLMGVGVVGIGFGVYQLLTRPDAEQRHSARLRLTPLAAGAALQGTF